MPPGCCSEAAVELAGQELLASRLTTDVLTAPGQSVEGWQRECKPRFQMRTRSPRSRAGMFRVRSALDEKGAGSEALVSTSPFALTSAANRPSPKLARFSDWLITVASDSWSVTYM